MALWVVFFESLPPSFWDFGCAVEQRNMGFYILWTETHLSETETYLSETEIYLRPGPGPGRAPAREPGPGLVGRKII